MLSGFFVVHSCWHYEYSVVSWSTVSDRGLTVWRLLADWWGLYQENNWLKGIIRCWWYAMDTDIIQSVTCVCRWVMANGWCAHCWKNWGTIQRDCSVQSGKLWSKYWRSAEYVWWERICGWTWPSRVVYLADVTRPSQHWCVQNDWSEFKAQRQSCHVELSNQDRTQERQIAALSECWAVRGVVKDQLSDLIHWSAGWLLS